MNNWFTTVRNIFRTKDLRARIFNTFLFVTIFRLGTFIILPGIDPSTIKKSTNSFLALLDTLLNSSSLRTASIFSLGIVPYISASIIMQVVSLTIPYFQRLKKEGASGKMKLNQITRILALTMVPIQGSGYIGYMLNANAAILMIPNRYYFFFLSILLLATSTMFCIWLADRISSKGLGNGSSVLILANMVSSLPGALYVEYDSTSFLFFFIELLLLFVIILTTIFLTRGIRKIPLQYATQMLASSTSYGGRHQYLPLSMNSAGVMPIIFAQTLTTGPLFCAKWLASRSTKAASIAAVLENPYSWQYNLILSALIFVATFFYAAIFINTTEIADDLKRSNGFIPGVKPGKKTTEYIDMILSRIALPSSIFLVLIAIMPVGAHKMIGVTKEMSRFFGGTSLLIGIGVIIDTSQKIESYLFSTYYSEMIERHHPIFGKKL